MFNLIKIENGRMNVQEPQFYEVTSNIAVSYGEALVLTGGKLAVATGSTKPTFIAMKDLSATDTNRRIPVARIESNQVYEVGVKFSATAASVVVGTKVTIHTDGLQVTDVATNGVATIVSALSANTNKADGDKVLVRFE